MKFEKEEEWVDESAAVRWKRRGLVIGLVLVVVVAGGGFWVWRAQADEAAEKAARRSAISLLSEQLKAAREAAEAPELAPEILIQRLESLVALQRRRLALGGDADGALMEELHRTEQNLEKLRADQLQKLSVQSEKTAQARLAAGDTDGAIAALRDALKQQRDVNAGVTESMQNFDREQRLQQEIARLVAEPLAALVKRRTQEARAAMSASRWDEALAALREAKETQERLNQEFPRSIYSDLPAIGRFDAEIASLTADGVDAQVKAHMERARVLTQQNDREGAVKELLAAANAQRELNEHFSRSRFVSMERLEQIETERQTLLAVEPWAAAHEKQKEALRHLRRRHIFNAQQCVRAGLELLEDVAARLPKARGQDDALRSQLAFLNVRSAELAAMQDRIFEQLAALPGEPRALLKGEVLQADFAKLLSTNPSRNPGRNLPTDSVTHAEAEEFCRRLGWVLGWRVRLPEEEDMRAAQAAGAEFQNVADGLDEWLAARPGGGGLMPVWGADGKVFTASRNERARARGFRVVVELDLARLGETD